jgi:uncharacterized damage-inducible protein DinB
MPVFNTIQLLTSLQNDVEHMLARMEHIKAITDTDMNRQPAPGKWSIAQVLEHLNSYNRYYLPEMEKALVKKLPAHTQFRSGWFGNYFTNMMAPKANGITNKMSAPKNHVPVDNLNSAQVIADFIKGQSRLLKFLKQAENNDMGKLRVPISISRFIKLKLGDTFRFLIAHQQRHFVQIDNILKVLDLPMLSQQHPQRV